MSKSALRGLGALAVALGLLVAPSIASADTGSYTVSTWAQNSLYNVRTWSYSPTLTAPAGVPSDAVITTVTGNFGFSAGAPSGAVYEGQLCSAALTACTAFGATTSSSAANWYPTTPLYAGQSAATWQIRFATQVNDHSTSSIKPALSPVRILLYRSITVNYEYTP
jgi:hypothetical protein